MTETKKIWGHCYEMDTGNKIDKVDMRISAKEDIISKCGDITNEKSCKHYKPSTYRKRCFHNRFGFACDRLIIKKEE